MSDANDGPPEWLTNMLNDHLYQLLSRPNPPGTPGDVRREAHSIASRVWADERMADEPVRDALVALCETVEATGGLTVDEDELDVPNGCPDWPDLADVYLDACKALGRKPVRDGEDTDLYET